MSSTQPDVRPDQAQGVHIPGAAIGTELEHLRAQLRACCQELRPALHAQGTTFIDETARYLDRLSCKIAVIGQVKAGKSTFINALVRRPGLLPTHVNPWTSAVTRLHFGTHESSGDVAARFTFFSPDEWRQLVDGSGRIRELTERLVPGFEVELLQHHVDAMRQRSEARLGERLAEVLGTEHEFNELSPEVLERYVCAGMERLAASSTEEPNLIFSDVVKQADLYFPDQDFGFPTVIIDTPGTNDPFLVRDEITRRVLDVADVHIVMLTARQALSVSDLALLRILRGLNRQRVVIYINRIDELADPANELPDILDFVKMRLSLELPGADFPIVAGSAAWALEALQIDTAATGTLSATVRDYADYLADGHAARRRAANDDGLPAASTPAGDAETLMRCSGLPDLCLVMGEMASRSHVSHMMRQIAGSFWEIAHLSQRSNQHEIDRLLQERARPRPIPAADPVADEAAQAESGDTNRIIGKLHRLLSDLRSRTDEIIAVNTSEIGETLRAIIEDFAAIEAYNLREVLAQRRRPDSWQCDVSPLRRRLHAAAVEGYAIAEQSLRDIEDFVLPKLRELLHSQLPGDRLPPLLAPTSEQISFPSLSALSEPVGLDLAAPWWQRWWGMKREPMERTAELKQIIREEFSAIARSLTATIRTHLEQRQSIVLHNTTVIFVSTAELLQQRNRERLARQQLEAERGAAARHAETERLRDVRIAELQHHVTLATKAIDRLQLIGETWNGRAE